MSRVGPEALALQTTRRWLILGTACVLITISTLLGARAWAQLSGLERAMLALSVSLVVLAVLLRRRRRTLWLAPAAVLCLSVPALLAPTETPGWIPMPNAVANAGYIIILLVPRWVGLAVALGNGVLLSIVISRNPTNVVGPALEVSSGRIVVAQIVAASLALWWAWQIQVREAAATDVDLLRREENARRAIAQQERAQVWRTTATRVHESVLNSIRYVLGTSTVDRVMLADSLVSTTTPPEQIVDSPSHSLIDLMDRLRADEAVGALVDVHGVLPRADLAPDVFEAARAALVEMARNSVRHGSATRVVVDCRNDGANTVIRMQDDGSGLSEGAPFGIGLDTVVGASLADIGGTWSLESEPERGVTATIVVPRRNAGRRSSEPFTPFDQGRFLVTSILAGSAAVGLAYFVLWAVEGGVRGLPILIAGGVSIAAALWLVVRRRRVGLVLGLVLSAGAAIVPWLLVGQSLPCSDVTSISPVVNIAGFAVLIIATWSRFATGAIGMAVWVSGVLVVVVTLPAGCGSQLALALLNSLAIIPVLLAVTYAGVRSFQRAQDRATAARKREIVEQSRAEAEMELNTTLYGAVDDALVLLREVADGAPVDPSMRTRLEVCDMRIRAAIQVDPLTAGAFSATARHLIERVAATGIPLDVRSLGSSDDDRPLPDEVTDLLTRVLSVRVDSPVVIQAFTTGIDDHLSVATSPVALQEAGLHDGQAVEISDVVIEVDVDTQGSDARGTVVVSRPVLAPGEDQ